MTESWMDPAAWLILLPLVWASVAFLAGPGRGARLAIPAMTAQLALALWLGSEMLEAGGRVHAVGGWGGASGHRP